MNDSFPRVVLDTVVFIQALLGGRGHAAGCIQRLKAGRFVLLMSDETIAELQDVPFPPKLRAKYPFITDEAVVAFTAEIESLSVRIPRPPPVLELPRDRKDEPLINLAVAGQADFIVTWNERHLTYLMKRDTPEGEIFCARFPTIAIVTPPAFLTTLDRLPLP